MTTRGAGLTADGFRGCLRAGSLGDQPVASIVLVAKRDLADFTVQVGAARADDPRGETAGTLGAWRDRWTCVEGVPPVPLSHHRC